MADQRIEDLPVPEKGEAQDQVAGGANGIRITDITDGTSNTMITDGTSNTFMLGEKPPAPRS